MFIDTHIHVSKYFIGDEATGKLLFHGLPSPETVLAHYDEVGIDCGFLMPLIGPEVYLPQSNEEILDICKNSNGRFIPFLNIDPRALKNSPESDFGPLFRYYKDKGFKGIGELMPNLPFLDPLVQNYFKHAEDVGFPITFDGNGRIGGTYGLYDDPGQPQLEACLYKFPKLKIFGHGPTFWAEISKLDTVFDRMHYPNYPIEEEGSTPKLMRRYENMYADLSAGSGYTAMSRDRQYAAKFMNEFQDKLVFGTDICSANMYSPMIGFMDEMLKDGKITQDVYEKIARKNAIRLFELDME